MRSTEMHQPYRYASPAGLGGSQAGAGIAIFFGILVGVFAWLLLGRTGLTTVMTLLGAVVMGSVVSYMSWRNLAVLVAIWLFTMSGFRAYAMIYMPFMPDVSLERVVVLWLLVLWALRLLMRRDQLRGPWLLDVLLLAHTAYVLANVMYIGNKIRLHEWTMSSVSPFLGYLIGKQVMYRDRDVRFLFIFMFLVILYYDVQSIAQKYNLTFLIWPKAILNLELGLWPEGRSRGPFRHPPLFGQMIAMFMYVQFCFFFRFKTRAAKALVLGTLVATGLALLFTYTRAPWIAAAAGVLTLAILRPRYRQLIAAIGVVLAVAIFIGAFHFANSELLQSRVGNTQTFENRLAAMSAAFRMWRDYPLFGIGYYNWEEFYPQYRRGEHIFLYGYVSRYAGKGIVVHDIFWGRLAEEGLISVSLLLAASAIVYFRLRYLWSRVTDTAWLNRDGLAVFAAIFVCYLVGGMAIDFRYFDLVNAVPYMFAGILMGYQVPEHRPEPNRYPLWTPPDFAKRDAQTAPAASQV